MRTHAHITECNIPRPYQATTTAWTAASTLRAPEPVRWRCAQIVNSAVTRYIIMCARHRRDDGVVINGRILVSAQRTAHACVRNLNVIYLVRMKRCVTAAAAPMNYKLRQPN